MARQAGVLQQRIEPVTLRRRRNEPRERVGREQDEGEETGAGQPLHRQGPRPQRQRNGAPDRGDHRAEQREDQHPEHHRALVVPPRAAELVDQRLGRMGIGRHHLEREVRDQKAVDQAAERQRHEDELADGRVVGEGHQAGVTTVRAEHGYDRLRRGDHERQHQRKAADLSCHPVASPRASGGQPRLRLIAGGPPPIRRDDSHHTVKMFLSRQPSRIIKVGHSMASRELDDNLSLEPNTGALRLCSPRFYHGSRSDLGQTHFRQHDSGIQLKRQLTCRRGRRSARAARMG